MKGLDEAPLVRAARDAVGDREGVWIVGGAVRDAALGREIGDLDLAVTDGEEEIARAVSRGTGGNAFKLSDEFATWRVAARGGYWVVDVAALRGPSIEADLGGRDFTVGAVAVPLGGGDPIDPLGGLADLENGVLRAAGPEAFSADPLRLLRAARVSAELGLELESETVELARREAARAGEPAGERQFAELRLLLTGPDPLRGLAVMDDLGVTAAMLPEVEGLRDVEQNPYHHLDVHGHTVAVLERWLELERDPAHLFGDLGPAITDYLSQPLADGLDRAGALRFACLFHDLGKPETRTVNDAGKVFFLGHDRAGTEIVERICARLRTSSRLASHLRLLTLHHLRLGFLVHRRPLSRRDIYEYLVATDPAPLDVTLLTVADRLATQGPKTRTEAIDAHLELAREVAGEALRWEGRPPPPVRGDELATALGLEPGPELGRLLDELSAASFAGEVSGREEAIEHARAFAAGR